MKFKESMKKMTPEQIAQYAEWHFAAKRDVVRILLAEVCLFCLVPAIYAYLHDNGPLSWIAAGTAVLAAILSIVREYMVSSGKAEARKSRYMWLVISLQFLCIPLLLIPQADNMLCHVLLIVIITVQLLAILLEVVVSPKK
ncbi:MAG: hypothetical protein KBT05_01370 [Bacteroidales bacterium]|nr:hypothetical protein [Candidatus Cryptobacteroides caccocaballi]